MSKRRSIEEKKQIAKDYLILSSEADLRLKARKSGYYGHQNTSVNHYVEKKLIKKYGKFGLEPILNLFNLPTSGIIQNFVINYKNYKICNICDERFWLNPNGKTKNYKFCPYCGEKLSDMEPLDLEKYFKQIDEYKPS